MQASHLKAQSKFLLATQETQNFQFQMLFRWLGRQCLIGLLDVRESPIRLYPQVLVPYLQGFDQPQEPQKLPLKIHFDSQ